MDWLSRKPILKKIVDNFSILFIGQGIASVVAFYAIVILARRLRTESFGIYSFAEATFMFFLMFIISGTDFLGTRRVAQNPKEAISETQDIITFRLAMGVFVFLALSLFIFFLKKPIVVRWTLFMFGAAFFTFSFLLNWLYLGLQRMRLVVAGTILRELLFLVGVFFFVSKSSDILKAGLVFFCSRLLHAIFLMTMYIRQFGMPRFRMAYKKQRDILCESFPILFSSIEGWIITSFDIFFIAIYLGDRYSGIYNAAFKPIFLLMTITTVYFSAVYPILSKASRHDKAEFSTIIHWTLFIMTAIWLPFVIVTYQIADKIILLMYGESYAASIPVFRFLLLSLLIIPVNSVYSRALISSGRQKENSFVSVAIIIANVFLNLLLIPRFGLMGAAFSKIVTWFGVLPLYKYFLERETRIYLFKSISAPLAAAAGMMVLLFCFFAIPSNIWVRLTVESVIYVLILAKIAMVVFRRFNQSLAFGEYHAHI